MSFSMTADDEALFDCDMNGVGGEYRTKEKSFHETSKTFKSHSNSNSTAFVSFSEM